MTDISRYATHKNKPTDYRRAKNMRSNPTDGEQILWYELRVATKDKGYRFRRQHPINPYIADFACLKLRLVVEVDGMSHDTRLDADAKRDAHLAAMGWEVMRFTNTEVAQNRDGVVIAILNRAKQILSGSD